MVKPLVQELADNLIHECRLNTIAKQRHVNIIVDGGWSHPGWWSRECTIFVIHAETGIPLGRKHVIKGVNYTGSSRGID